MLKNRVQLQPSPSTSPLTTEEVQAINERALRIEERVDMGNHSVARAQEVTHNARGDIQQVVPASIL
jgi:hypothetical protein